MNYADKKTEHELKKMEAHIRSIYREAWRDLEKEVNDYYAKFAQRDAEMKQLVHLKYVDKRGELWTEERYRKWRVAQIGRGERWEIMRDKMAKRMLEANKVAAAYINDRTPTLYSLNANYTAYELEKILGRDDFTLINEQAVKKLAMCENLYEFKVSDGAGGYTYRRLQVNPPVDYSWNSKRIESAMLTGLLHGVEIKDMTNRFFDVMGSNRNAAIRNARTAVTSAQNAGHQATYEAAEDMGIDIKKMWVARLDERTRDSHAGMDGEIRGVRERFSNGLMSPGDPSGAPGEVYNCRCRQSAYLPGITNLGRTRAAKDENGRYIQLQGVTYKGVGGTESYEEWLKRKRTEGKEE